MQPHIRPSAPLDGLRVALVHDWLTGMRGGEKCLEVLCQSFPTAPLYTLIHRRGALSPTIEAMAIQTSPLQKIPGVARHYRKLLPLMPLAAKTWRIKDVDLVISLSHCVAKSVRVPQGVPHVCYCFTPMRYAWDGRDAYLASWRGRPFRQAAAGALLDRLRAWDKTSADGVSHFVAISQTVRDRIASCYERESHVIQPPVDTLYYSPIDIERESFYLCVSALVPYKRIDQAVEACTATGRRLVIIGTGPQRDQLERRAGPTVSFLGWQSDEVVRDHFRRCRALIFPGEEDFGIVPIEALACKTPVIALGRGGAAETIDDTVGAIYPDPTTESLVHALDWWEASGMPHHPAEARRKAEALALPLFRERLLSFLGEVVRKRITQYSLPAPHLDRSTNVRAPREV